MKLLLKLTIIIMMIISVQSCGVSAKRKGHTVTLLKCQGQELIDIRKKYCKREKQLERRNERKLRKIDKVKSKKP